jgi:N-acetylglucosaminyl-diphospho-decaprenol L-rhamnosyltransferase
MKVSLVMPVFNNLDLTKLCVESIEKNTPASDYEFIVVDNASTDGTPGYIKTKNFKYIRNSENMGVAKAWNAGVKASDAEYVCVINNDILAGSGWLKALVDFYESRPGAGIVSPGTRWGRLDYDFEPYAESYMKKMKSVTAEGFAGWCMLIKKDRFEKAGYFCEDYRIGTGEDTDFYNALKKAGYKSYVTGSSFIHHFGSKTLKVMRKKEKGFEEENNRIYYAKWGIKPDNYWQRKRKSLVKFLTNSYLKLTHGHTLNEKRHRAAMED